LVANFIRSPLVVDERRNTVNSGAVITGTDVNFDPLMQTCSDWADAGAGNSEMPIANPLGGPREWTDGRQSTSCNIPVRVYCFQNTSSAPATLPSIPAQARRVFRTHDVHMPTSLADADFQCAGEASTAGLMGTWKALLASTTVTAATNANLVATTEYWRVDGVLVGTGADLRNGALKSGIWVYADGSPLTLATIGFAPDTVWSGATNTVSVGSNASTCDNWTSTAGTVYVGISNLAGSQFRFFFDTFGSPISCAVDRGLYCVEQ
jgi:hypothetical protein